MASGSGSFPPLEVGERFYTTPAIKIAKDNVPKNDAKSRAFREMGNRHFVRGTVPHYLMALQYYNRSLCFALEESENLAIAYANRSAVYFKFSMFANCVENIDLAFRTRKYPQDLTHKLYTRRMCCKLILSSKDCSGEDEWKEPRLSYPPHPKVSSIANCLEIRENSQFGRHLVTTRDLYPGDIIGILKPLCVAKANRYQYERCENCSLERWENLIPCPTCTVTMFCDEKCKREALNGFHKYECPFINLIKLAFPNQQIRLALRLVTRGFALYRDMDKFLDATERAFRRGEMDIDSNCTNDHQFAGVASLKKKVVNDRTPLVNNLMYICEKIVQRHNLWSQKLRLAEFRKAMRNVLSQYLRLVDGNGLMYDDLSYHIVKKRTPNYNEVHIENNMCGLFPLVHLVPHSCIPNIVCSSYTDGKIMSVVRPILAGSQIFNSFS